MSATEIETKSTSCPQYLTYCCMGQQQLQRPLPARGQCAQAKTQTKDTINAPTLHSIVFYFIYGRFFEVSGINYQVLSIYETPALSMCLQLAALPF
jgi:hypothetical protein